MKSIHSLSKEVATAPKQTQGLRPHLSSNNRFPLHQNKDIRICAQEHLDMLLKQGCKTRQIKSSAISQANIIAHSCYLERVALASLFSDIGQLFSHGIRCYNDHYKAIRDILALALSSPKPPPKFKTGPCRIYLIIALPPPRSW